MKTKEIIGKNIQVYRKKMGFTQDEVADYLGIDRSMISNFENAEKDISLVQLKKISDLFCVDVEDFLEEDATQKCANLAFAFRKENIELIDLNSIASFQKIVKNYLLMTELMNQNE